MAKLKTRVIANLERKRESEKERVRSVHFSSKLKLKFMQNAGKKLFFSFASPSFYLSFHIQICAHQEEKGMRKSTTVCRTCDLQSSLAIANRNIRVSG